MLLLVVLSVDRKLQRTTRRRDTSRHPDRHAEIKHPRLSPASKKDASRQTDQHACETTCRLLCRKKGGGAEGDAAGEQTTKM